MLSVDSLEKGVVIDHIQAGRSMEIYQLLNLDALDSCVAIIKNVKSNRMGRKDIIKIEDRVDTDLEALGFLDQNITVNIIEDGSITRKMKLTLPERVRNIIRCRNPRCITSVESSLPHEFVLADPERGVYRCIYCEQEAEMHRHGSRRH
ncbi:MAG: aspartate carbamoyltransferase regulatory subunit [Clostridia bacterium]|nr:aspartate carbamoyltransferase regulatory subunit [Clostridia bacterium]